MSDSTQTMPSLPQILREMPGSYHPGWGGIPEYSGWADEQMAWKETCTIGDDANARPVVHNIRIAT